MKKSVIILLSLLLAVCVFFGCAPSSSDSDTTPGDESTSPNTTDVPGPDPATPIGTAELPLISKDPETGLLLIDRTQTNLGCLVADAYRAAAGSDLAFVTARELGKSISEGDITLGCIADALPNERDLVTVNATGAEILDCLELAYSSLPTKSSDYIHFSGCSLVLDMNKTPTLQYDENGNFTGISGDRRVTGCLVAGEALDPEKTYTVTITSGGYSLFADTLKSTDRVSPQETTNREAVIAYITDTLSGKVGAEYSDLYGDGRVQIIPLGHTDIPQPASMLPQVYITADEKIPRDYVDCKVAVYDPTGVYPSVYDAESKIKIRGNSTSSGAKSPYNIKFDSKVELLGLGEGKKWCLLANMYDKTQFRNTLAYELALDAGISYTSSSRFAEVYVNGEYRGMYQITEPVDVGKTMVDIDTDNYDSLLEVEPFAGYAGSHSIVGPQTGIILAFNEPEEPDEEQEKRAKYLISLVELALMSNDYEMVKQYVDVESFAQNYAVQELFKNVDYVQSSTRYYIKNGKLYEGPVWDFDLSTGNCSNSYYPAYNNTSTSGLSYEGIYCVTLFNQYLFRYEEFKTLVFEKYLELQPRIVNLYQDNELGKCKIDAMCEKYADAIERNNELWTTAYAHSIFEHTPVDGTYEGEITYLKDWLKNRNQFILDHYGLSAEN